MAYQKTDYRQHRDRYNTVSRGISDKHKLIQENFEYFNQRLLNLKKSSLDIQIPFSAEYLEYDRQINHMLDLTPEEMLGLFKSNKISRTPYNVQDIKRYKALMLIHFQTHARASDLDNLKVGDIDFKNGEISINAKKNNISKVGVLDDFNNELKDLLKDLTKGRGRDDLLFPSKLNLLESIQTDDLNRFIKNLADADPLVDGEYFSLIESADELGDDYKKAVSKTFRKHGAALLTLSRRYFDDLGLDVQNYIKNDLGHRGTKIQSIYNKIAKVLQIKHAEGDLEVQTKRPHPRSVSMINAHIKQAQKSRIIKLWNNSFESDRTAIKMYKTATNPTVKKEATKKINKRINEVKNQLSEFDLLKKRLQGEVSPNKIESLIMPIGLTEEEAKNWMKRKARGEIDLPSPITDPDPRLAESSDLSKIKKARFISDPAGRSIALGAELKKDYELIGKFWDAGSEYKAKWSIDLPSAVPQILNKFLNEDDFINVNGYINAMAERTAAIANRAANVSLDINDLWRLTGDALSWDDAGDLNKFFGDIAKEGDLGFKIPPKVAGDFIDVIEYRSRLNQLANNLVDSAYHTLLPNNLTDGFTRLDYVIRELEKGLGKWVDTNGDEAVSSIWGFTADQQGVSNKKFIQDLTESLYDLSAQQDNKEYTPLREEYFDEVIDKNSEFFNALDDTVDTRYTVYQNLQDNDPRNIAGKNSLKRAIYLEPLFQVFNQLGENVFNDEAYDVHGSKRIHSEYDRPFSERIEFKKNGNPALRQKDFRIVNRTNFARELFNEYIPEIIIRDVNGKPLSAGVIEFVDNAGDTPNIVPPDSVGASTQAMETKADAHYRRLARGIRTVVKTGVAIASVGPAKLWAFGVKAVVNVGPDVGLEYLLYDEQQSERLARPIDPITGRRADEGSIFPDVILPSGATVRATQDPNQWVDDMDNLSAEDAAYYSQLNIADFTGDPTGATTNRLLASMQQGLAPGMKVVDSKFVVDPEKKTLQKDTTKGLYHETMSEDYGKILEDRPQGWSEEQEAHLSTKGQPEGITDIFYNPESAFGRQNIKERENRDRTSAYNAELEKLQLTNQQGEENATTG